MSKYLETVGSRLDTKPRKSGGIGTIAVPRLALVKMAGNSMTLVLS